MITSRAGLFTAIMLVVMIGAFAVIRAHANPITAPMAVQTTMPEQVTLNFGSFGIVQGQVARLNLVPLTDPPQPDHAELMFLGEDGKVLARTLVALGAGQSASLELSMDALGLTGNRLQLRAKVRFVDPPQPDADPPGERTIATVEVMERGGRTNFMLPYFIVGADPPGELGQ